MRAPVVERRLAAILAADVVGYSRLVEADEAGTLTAWRGSPLRGEPRQRHHLPDASLPFGAYPAIT